MSVYNKEVARLEASTERWEENGNNEIGVIISFLFRAHVFTLLICSLYIIRILW
jgi:hypothetical protein